MKPLRFNSFTKTLRGRLSLWFLVTVVFTVVLFSFVVSILFWFTLKDQIDHHVHIAVTEARQVVENYQPSEWDSLIKNLVSGKGMTVVVLSPDGAPVLETNSPDIALVTEHQLQTILASIDSNQGTPVHFTEGDIRFAAMSAKVKGGKGIVAVGYSTAVIYATFYKLLFVVAGTVIFLILPVTVLANLQLKKQLQPLESIAKQAESIRSFDSLSTRIKGTMPTQELVSIKDALNDMLERLWAVFSQEQEFFADAAHTLKSPLAILKAQLEQSNWDKKADAIKTISSTNDMIQDLLFLSKITSATQPQQPFNLSQVVSAVAELATTLAQTSQVHVSSQITPGIQITGDKQAVQRAIMNLVHNAIKYNQPQGKVFIKLSRAKNKITLIIEDTGIGISTADQKKLFTRFFRGRSPVKQGSGLGLAIAKTAVQKAGGTLAITSQLHRGTKAVITF